MSLFKKQKAVSGVDANTTYHGESQLPDHPEVIRVLPGNDNFFYRLYGDLATDQCEVVVERPCKAIIIRDGVASEVLSNGKFPIFETVTKGHLFKKEVKKLTAVTIYVFNPDYQYQTQWGTPTRISYRDPQTQEPVSFGANGTYEMNVVDVQKFFDKVVGGSQKFSVEDFAERTIVLFNQYFKEFAVAAILEDKVNYIDLQAKVLEIANKTREAISAVFTEQYGVSVPILAINSITMSEDDVARVEGLLKSERVEAKTKRDVKEVAAELERLADKEYEREMALRKLEKEDRATYLEVLKILGWPENKAKAEGKHFCPKCGEPVGADDQFCNNCGAEVKPKAGRVCPKCGKELKGKVKFCSNCGTEIK